MLYTSTRVFDSKVPNTCARVVRGKAIVDVVGDDGAAADVGKVCFTRANALVVVEGSSAPAAWCTPKDVEASVDVGTFVLGESETRSANVNKTSQTAGFTAYMIGIVALAFISSTFIFPAIISALYYTGQAVFKTQED